MSRRKEWTESPLFATPWEFAKLLNVCETSIYRQLAAGKLEGVQIGRAWRLPVNQLPGIQVTDSHWRSPEIELRTSSEEQQSEGGDGEQP